MARPLQFIILLVSLAVSSAASAAPYEVASCTGLIVENRAISITLRRGITDGSKPSRIDMYIQDLKEPNQPVHLFDSTDCVTDRIVGDDIVCETILGETYKINYKTLMATEAGISGDLKPYENTYSKCVVHVTPTENPLSPLYMNRY